VSSEWRTFHVERSGPKNDPSRVGGPENPLLDGDLSTIIGPGTGSASFDDMGNNKYKNHRTVSIRFFIFYTLFISIIELWTIKT